VRRIVKKERERLEETAKREKEKKERERGRDK
jgi:hypothetical protein